MKKLFQIRNIIIIALCITIICLCFGFTYLSMKLENLTGDKNNFNLSFVKVTPRTPVQGGSKAPTGTSSISNSGKTVNMQFNLYSPYDELSYEITIRNEGTIPAEIINLVEVPDYINDSEQANEIYPVQISHNDIVGKKVNPGEEITLTILAYYSYKAQQVPIQIPYQISLLASSVQD